MNISSNPGDVLEGQLAGQIPPFPQESNIPVAISQQKPVCNTKALQSSVKSLRCWAFGKTSMESARIDDIIP